MRIRFIRTVLVEVAKAKLNEVWDKQFCRWDEIKADSINYANGKAEICTLEGDTLMDVPADSFEVVNKDSH